MGDLTYVDDRRALEPAAVEQELEVGDAGGQVGTGGNHHGRSLLIFYDYYI
jgi:hypothetical protein